MKSVSEGIQIDNLNNVFQCNTVNCTTVNKDALWSTSNSNQISDKIPYEINISNLSVIDSYKLSRYIFPKHDHGPTKAGLKDVTPVQSLEYAVQLCLHRVPRDLKVVWDEMSGRDSSHPEISQMVCSLQNMICVKDQKCTGEKRTKGCM